MGFIFTDLVVETVLREGLENFKNPLNIDARLAVLYDQLKESFLNTEYGQAELDRFKTFLTDNKIDIVQSYRLIQERIPCISINSSNAAENTGRAFIGDYTGDVDEVVGGVIVDRKEQNTIPIQDKIEISIHTADPAGNVALRWLHALVLFLLFSQKKLLEDRGIDLSTFSSTPFSRVVEYLPENVYSRFITFDSLNYIQWTEKDSQVVLTNIDIHGGPGASDPGAEEGGIKVESGQDSEYEEGSFYTIDET